MTETKEERVAFGPHYNILYIIVFVIIGYAVCGLMGWI